MGENAMIIVTGCAGLVGRSLCQRLLTEDLTFIPVARHRSIGLPPNVITTDLSSSISALWPYRGRIKTIVHLAAAVPHSASYPDNELSANLTRSIDANVLQLQQMSGAHVIYISTCGLYDRASQLVKCESDPIIHTTPYFAVKAVGEACFNMQTCSTILRLAAPIGPGLKKRLVLSRFITAARNNQELLIWGTGKREQSFIDVMDVSELIIRIIRKPIRATLNVAASSPTSMLGLAQAVVTTLNSGTVRLTSHVDPHEGETARYSINKAHELYDWRPSISLDQSILKLAKENFEVNE